MSDYEYDIFISYRAEAAGLAGGRTLTIPIQSHDGKNYPELLSGDGPRAIDFTEFRAGGKAWRDSPLYFDYQRALNRLATEVAELIAEVPPFDPGWTLVDPDTVAPRQGSPGSWTSKFQPDPAAAAGTR